MDPKPWNRTIEEHPIADGLDEFHCHARRMGVCDIAAIDRLLAKAEVLEELRGSFVVDLANVGAAITQKNIEGDTLRPLLIAAITKADDKTLWDEALTLTLTANNIGTTFPAPLPNSSSPRIGALLPPRHQYQASTYLSINVLLPQQFHPAPLCPSDFSHHPSTPQTAENFLDQCKTGLGPAFNDGW
ncbi:hypothetical protein E4U19_005018 [Claviceps sp. Clav32 group G5]|nr:hypothetical protein E4U19_005018 [Claviceps sp. Clav32 group G5]